MNEHDLVRFHIACASASSQSREVDRRFRRTVLKRVIAGMIGIPFSLPVYALTVGEPRQASNLFEPLRVDIPIDSNADSDNLHVRLMLSAGDETGTGDSSLLRRELITDANGHRILRITTATPIREPLMTLHVDVSEGDVQFRRDVTLLFDPPSGDAASATAFARDDSGDGVRLPSRTIVADSESGSGSGRSVATSTRTARAATRRSPAASVATRVSGPVPASATVAANDVIMKPRRTRRVAPGETLEQIAMRVRPSEDTRVEMMAMLLRWQNPRAFDAHTGVLLPGAHLRLPSRSTVVTQLAAFSPTDTAGDRVEFASASGRGSDRTAVAFIPAVHGSRQPSGLLLAEGLTAGSSQLLASLAKEGPAPLPAATVASVPVARPEASAALVAAVPATTSPTPTPAPAPVQTAGVSLAARPEKPPTAGAPVVVAMAGIGALPVPTIFPAWLIAAALLMSGGMMAAVGRLLRRTPELAGRMHRPQPLTRQHGPALVHEGASRLGTPSSVALLLPTKQTGRLIDARRDEDIGEELTVLHAQATGPTSAPESAPVQDWDPDFFDLSRSDLDDAAGAKPGKPAPQAK